MKVILEDPWSAARKETMEKIIGTYGVLFLGALDVQERECMVSLVVSKYYVLGWMKSSLRFKV